MSASKRLSDRGRRPDIEEDLANKYNVGWQYHSGMPTSEFDIERGLDNQARFQAINRDKVEEYREAVERGDAFPAVIAYRPGRAQKAPLVSIDGNHRLVAHDEAKKGIDVYEIDRGTRAATIALMNYAFNARHGLGITDEEKIHHALFLYGSGSSQEQAAAEVNVPLAKLQRAVSKAKADQRAVDMDLDPREWEVLAQASKGKLNAIATDEGFVAASKLAYKARLTSGEVAEMVQELNTSRGAAKQKSMVRTMTDAYLDRIQDLAGGTNASATRPLTPRARLVMTLGNVMALPDDLAGLAAAFADAERDEISVKITDAANKLTKLARHVNPRMK